MNTWDCCRTCLATSTLNPIFGNCTKQEKYTNILSKATGIKINMNDGLPQEMCSTCIATVNKITTFHKICNASNRTLLDLIDTTCSRIKNDPEHSPKYSRDNVIRIDISDSSECDDDDDDSREGGCSSPSSSANVCPLQDKGIFQGVPIQPALGLHHPARTGHLSKVVGSVNRSNSSQLDFTSNPLDISVTNRDNYIEFKSTVEDLLRKRTQIEFENSKYIPKFKKEKRIKPQVVRINAKKQQLNTYECEYCHKRYASKYSYDSHLKIHTGTKLICQHCGKQFLTKRRLLFHCKSKHGYEKTDKCSYCDWTGVSPEARKTHERLHTGEKPYVCEVCSAAFSRVSSYLQHRPTHLPDKTVPCDLCPAMFKSVTLMRIHKTRHKPRTTRNKCRLCDSSFKDRWHCARHIRRIHGVTDVDAHVEKIKFNNAES